MQHKFVTAALALLLLFTAAGCGSTAANNAGDWNRTAAYRGSGDGHRDDTPFYRADDAGQVDGYPDRSSADSSLREGGRDLKDAGDDLADAARNAGESVGHAAEGALDSAKRGLDSMTR